MTMLEQFSFGSTVLINDALRLPFQQSLLKENTGLLGVSFLSLSAWMDQLVHEDLHTDQLLFVYRETLMKHQEQFSIFRSQFQDAAFLKECAQFAAELKLYGVSLDMLPQRNESEKELKAILSLLIPFTNEADHQKQILAKVQAMEDASRLWIYPSFFTYFQQQVVDLLLQKGAQLITFTFDQRDPQFYSAVNMRQEIEGIAQQIIEQDQPADDIALCVLDPFYEALACQIFERYQIPYTLLSTHANNELSMQVEAWLRYLAQPDSNTLQTLLTSKIFAFDTDAFLRYAQLFQQEVHEPILPKAKQAEANALVDTYTLTQLQRLEEKAMLQQPMLSAVLQKAQQLPPQETLSFLCAFFAERYSSPSNAQVRCMKQIQTLFQEAYPYIHTQEDLLFLAQLLNEKKLSNSYDQLGGVLVHTIHDLHYERKIRYVCGATMNAWPNFAARSGIFDERYCANLSLPSMEQRYRQHLAQCEKLYHAQSTLIITYPLGSYEGKNNEASLEIEQYMERCGITLQTLPLTNVHASKHRIHSLDPMIARQLYLQNNELRGSISAFERYRQCPFSYFLRYGLHLKKQKNEIDNAQIGSLIHVLLQQLCEQYGKAYVDIQAEELAQRIKNECNTLIQLYPQRAAAIMQMQKRLNSQLTALFKRMASLEAHNHLHVRAQEQPFTYTLPLDDAHLCMHGVIDRIDASNHMAVILDYKSSKKTLSETKVFSGLQLQLLTYAIVLENGLIDGFEEIKEVLGAFYVSIKPESILQPAMKINRQKKECRLLSKEDILEEQNKKQRLNGWIFSENIDLFDDDATHVANLKYSNGKVVGRDKNAIRSLKLLAAGMETILRFIGNSILQGDISCEPADGACSYCDFHCICRFHGQPYPKQAIIDENMNACINEKEAKHDAEME